MQDKLTVRRASTAELAEIAAAEEEIFPDPWSEASLLSHQSSAGGVTLVAIFEGRMCGFLTARLLPPECELYRIAVLPQARRRGVGRALTEALLRLMKEADCTDCFLEVRASNSPAIALYTACGFREIGRRRRYYHSPTEDAILMQKP